MNVVGRRYRLAHEIIAEVFHSGAVCLRRGTLTQEFYDNEGKLNSTTNEHISLRGELGAVGSDLRTFIYTHGRPYGMIWG